MRNGQEKLSWFHHSAYKLTGLIAFTAEFIRNVLWLLHFRIAALWSFRNEQIETAAFCGIVSKICLQN